MSTSEEEYRQLHLWIDSHSAVRYVYQIRDGNQIIVSDVCSYDDKPRTATCQYLGKFECKLLYNYANYRKIPLNYGSAGLG